MTTTSFGFVGTQKRNDEIAQQGPNTPEGGDRRVSAREKTLQKIAILIDFAH